MTRRDIDDLELWLAFPVTLLIGSVVFSYFSKGDNPSFTKIFVDPSPCSIMLTLVAVPKLKFISEP